MGRSELFLGKSSEKIRERSRGGADPREKISSALRAAEPKKNRYIFYLKGKILYVLFKKNLEKIPLLVPEENFGK